jgi:adenylate cyclase
MREELSRDAEKATIDRHVNEEANRAVAIATLYAAWFGLFSAVVVSILLAVGALRGLLTAAIFAGIAGAYATLLHVFAKRGRLRGATIYLLLLPFVSLPTAFFLTAHALLPWGAATWISGPFAYLYYCLIIVTGFFFDKKLSRIAGAVAAVEYSGCVLLAHPYLARIHADDVLTQQDLTQLPVYLLRATIMLLAGFLVGSLATGGRILLHRVLAETTEKQGLSRIFGEFVSPEVKDKILADRAHLTGERKEVVVLFSDIRGFTTYTERADPTELVQHLNLYFDRMVSSIRASGGIVDKFIGDAVMAVFGGVLPLDNPAASALDAARSMRKELRALNQAGVASNRLPLDNGIGMHFGEVLQGVIGSSDRKDFTVIGDVVNTASRIEGVTKDHGFPILVTRAFVDALPESRRAECVPVGMVKLKGKEAQVELFGVADS